MNYGGREEACAEAYPWALADALKHCNMHLPTHTLQALGGGQPHGSRRRGASPASCVLPFAPKCLAGFEDFSSQACPDLPGCGDATLHGAAHTTTLSCLPPLPPGTQLQVPQDHCYLSPPPPVFSLPPTVCAAVQPWHSPPAFLLQMVLTSCLNWGQCHPMVGAQAPQKDWTQNLVLTLTGCCNLDKL